jgi:hypothetical protein
MTTPSLILMEDGGTEGFTAGDLEVQGYLAVIPAFQKIWFADGRPATDDINTSGMHKLDFINTRIESTATVSWVKGDVVSQTNAGGSSVGIFDEVVDRGSGVYWILIYRTTTNEFTTGYDIVQATHGTLANADITGIVSPPHWLNWTPIVGDLPDGGSNIGCLCFGRIFLNSMLNPHQWSCSRLFDPLDWNTGATDVGAATISQNAKAGEVGDAIVAMIPYKDSYLIWGCANTMWILRSDPLQGGVNTCLSKATGIFSPTAYCWDDKNNLYFLGIDGIYSLSSDAIASALPPENITKKRMPKLITSLALNRRTDRVVMAYDKQRYGLQVSITQQDGQWSVNFWIDLRTGGLFPDTFPEGQTQSSLFYFDSYKSEERGLLLGGYDGYIRKLDETAKADEGSNIINSWVTLGAFNNPSQPRKKVGINEVSLTLGESSDGIGVDVYSANSSDLLVDNILTNQDSALNKSFTGDSLKNSIIDKVAGIATAIKISNSTINQSWSIEDTNIELSDEGRKKG